MTTPSPFQRADAATQRALISQLLDKDDELRVLATTLVKAALRESINQLLRGDASTKAAIARAYAGVVTKAITETDADDADVTLRAEMQTMFAEMRGEMGMDDLEDDALPVESQGSVGKVMVPKS